MAADEDGFVRVTGRRKARARPMPPSYAANFNDDDDGDDAVDVAALATHIRAVAAQLQATPLGKQTVEHVRRAAAGRRVRLVCYGVGRLARSRQSQAQLAFLLCLREALGDVVAAPLVCEPAFGAADHALVALLDMAVLADNAGGRVDLLPDDGDCAVLFMPHCPLELTNAVLWAHWAPARLSRLLLIGNSFDHYETSLTARQLGAQGPLVQRALAITAETPLHRLNHGHPKVQFQ